MYRMFWKSFAIALLLNGASFGQSGQQSLGDVARANREKLAAQEATGKTPRVITNKDLPADPPEVQEASAEPMTMVSGVNRPSEERSSDRSFARQNFADQRAGEQWRGRIREQESRVADLQARIDQMKALMHRGGSAEFEGPSNRYQARAMQHVAQMQEMLDRQKEKLSMMQDAARRAGMHTSVYDP